MVTKLPSVPPSHQTRRADAERNRALIIEAAAEAFADDPNASTAQIAKAAGVGRVTLYGHFPSREILLKAVLDHLMAEAEAILTAQGLSDPAGDDTPADQVLAKVVRSSWQTLDRMRRVRRAALQELGPAQLRKAHQRTYRKVEQLIRRGQRQGAFRDDLPASWLTSTVYALIHGAADEVDAGNVTARKVPDLLEASVLGALGVPPDTTKGTAFRR